MKQTGLKAGMVAVLLICGCSHHKTGKGTESYGDVTGFLSKHTKVVELSDPSGQARLAVVPAWQGRVMTSTDGGLDGMSYGWVNKEFIASGRQLKQFNPFGGEDRIWIGPEGGQFSIFFPEGSDFDLEDWQTPAELDTEPFDLLMQANDRAEFGQRFQLKNYSGTVFNVKVERTIRLLTREEAWGHLGESSADSISLVAYESINKLRNVGSQAWSADTGLLSIWSMGMFNASPEVTVVVPFKAGPESEMGVAVNPDYFGDIPPERLVIKDDIAFFSGDGMFRSKIGVSRHRAKPIAGSYDGQSGVLTIVQFSFDEEAERYVNSQWKIQDYPYGGDVFNSYNDDGNLGSFYELESLSPALELLPGEAVEHTHRTIHMRGGEKALDAVARAVLGAGLDEIRAGLPSADSFCCGK